MKLANPRTIQTTLSEERRMDVDNGIKLARKVDTLRDTLEKLEKRHALFLEGTQIELRNKTKELLSQIHSLEEEIKMLEAKRKELLIPLYQEWERVKEREGTLDEREEKIKELRTDLTYLKGELDKREESLQIDELRNEETRRQVTLHAQKVSDALLEAQNTLLNARDEEKDIKDALSKRQSNMVKKEKEVELRENNITLREQNITLKEKEITNETIRLADMRATLERALKRHG